MKKFLSVLGIVFGLLLVSPVCVMADGQDDIDKIKTITEIGKLSNSGKYDSALEKCEIAIKKYPKDYELYYWRASIKSNMGNNKEAIKDYTEAIKINPKDGVAYVMRGISKAELKDYDGAIADYNHAIMIDPKDGSAYSMRACAKLDIGDMDGAAKDLQIANKLFDEEKK